MTPEEICPISRIERSGHITPPVGGQGPLVSVVFSEIGTNGNVPFTTCLAIELFTRAAKIRQETPDTTLALAKLDTPDAPVDLFTSQTKKDVCGCGRIVGIETVKLS